MSMEIKMIKTIYQPLKVSFLKTSALFFILVSPVNAAVIDVFFAGGQSNANQFWADGINSVLEANYENALLVHNNHNGNWLEEWYTDGPQRNYVEDFYREPGTGLPGLLQSTLDGIIANGDTYRFRGFFWYQGVSEMVSDSAAAAYEDRFMSMLGQIQSDLGLDPFRYMIAAVEADRTGWRNDKNSQIEAIRSAQFSIGDNPLGMTYDIATGGYTFVDHWHLSEASVEQAGIDMATAFVTAVPVPAAVWLFGSGLIGLVAVARRKQA